MGSAQRRRGFVFPKSQSGIKSVTGRSNDGRALPGRIQIIGICECDARQGFLADGTMVHTKGDNELSSRQISYAYRHGTPLSVRYGTERLPPGGHDGTSPSKCKQSGMDGRTSLITPGRVDPCREEVMIVRSSLTVRSGRTPLRSNLSMPRAQATALCYHSVLPNTSGRCSDVDRILYNTFSHPLFSYRWHRDRR